MDLLRTPDERFDGLAGWTFAPVHTDVRDADGTTLRVHHVDEGPPGGPAVLCMHGEPSWAYLYRHMIPVFVERGLRVIAPDLIGFGRSDKPTQTGDYTYERHVQWMSQWLEANDLRDLTLVCQDWGGLIGLRLVTAFPERFARVVVANTGLPTGDRKPTDAFLAWQRFSAETEDFPVGALVNGGCTTELAPDVVAAYDAPFPDDRYKAGARIFPSLVPTAPDDPSSAANRAAWEVLERWEKPFLCAFSDQDPITRGGDRPFRERVPGASGQPHTTIEGGGHFLQEDRGPVLAGVVADWLAST